MKPNYEVLALNAVCPYYTMFPLDFPARILKGASDGEWVYDPFCGRGSTNFAARVAGLPSVGVDVNPVAVAIAQAKLVCTTPAAIVRACEAILESRPNPGCIPEGEFWNRCYHADTLREMCCIREALIADSRSAARQALRAFILGRLHGPRTTVPPFSYLSNQMPRTYAAKPAYAVRYWKNRGMKPPKVDVLDLVRRKAARYFGSLPEATTGIVLEGDSRRIDLKSALRRASGRKLAPRITWVVTSPPYYGMRTYLPDQWLRYWFLGGPSSVTYADHAQLAHSSPVVFAESLALVWRNTASACDDGARLVVRFGGISDRVYPPRDILYESFALADCGWHVVTAKSAGQARAHVRQASQFLRSKPAEQIEEYDVFARLS